MVNKEDALSLISQRRKAVAERIGAWSAGRYSTIKIISGDFRSGRTSIRMDGLVLRNRDGQIEIVGFDRIVSIARLQEERRGSTLERIKGATAGGLVGGGAASVAAMLALGITGPVGAVLGGAIGVMLAVKRKYRHWVSLNKAHSQYTS